MLSRVAIRHMMKAGLIQVTPDPVNIGPNSIDLRLGDSLKMYHPTEGRVTVVDPLSGGHYLAIDPRSPPPLVDVPQITRSGGEYAWLLVPGQFYLGVTLEETYCRGVVPHLDGRSTCGRLSIEAHKTAGVGDNGFRGRWTLEIEATEPVILRPRDRLFQVYFTPAWGEGLTSTIDALVQGGDVLLAPWASGQIDGQVSRARMPLIEVDDLYGGDGHHYQDSGDLRGPSPLDE